MKLSMQEFQTLLDNALKGDFILWQKLRHNFCQYDIYDTRVAPKKAGLSYRNRHAHFFINEPVTQQESIAFQRIFHEANGSSPNDYAISMLGVFYRYGWGVPANLPEAVRLYTLAAKRNNPFGQDELGLCYYFGTGLPVNYAEARKCFEASAQQGNPRALNHLSCLYREGKGVIQDTQKAGEMLHRAAKQGDQEASDCLLWRNYGGDSAGIGMVSQLFHKVRVHYAGSYLYTPKHEYKITRREKEHQEVSGSVYTTASSGTHGSISTYNVTDSFTYELTYMGPFEIGDTVILKQNIPNYHGQAREETEKRPVTICGCIDTEMTKPLPVGVALLRAMEKENGDLAEIVRIADLIVDQRIQAKQQQQQPAVSSSSDEIERLRLQVRVLELQAQQQAGQASSSVSVAGTRGTTFAPPQSSALQQPLLPQQAQEFRR